MIEVEAGGVVYEFPDGYPADKIKAHITRHQGAPQSRFGGILDAFTKGAVFGAGDELTAAESALLGRAPGDSFRERYDYALAAERAQNKRFQEENPTTAMGAEIAGAVLSPVNKVVAPVMTGGVTAGNIARGAGVGLPLGTAYGYLSGEGEGDRLDNAVTGGVTGAIGGAVAVPVAAGVSALGQGLLKRLGLSGSQAPIRAGAKKAGMSPQAYNTLADVAERDAAMGPGIGGIKAAGPDGMLLDAGPYAQSVGRLALNTPAGASVGLPRVQDRAMRAAGELDSSLDAYLGTRQGIQSQARANAQSTAAAREQAYKAAFDTPIDYTADGGKAILDALRYIPPKTFAKAVREANEELISEFGDDPIRGRQWNIKLGGNGAAEIVEDPNLRQLDALKRALQKMGQETVDLGVPSGAALRAQKQAARLRAAMGQASEAYNAATRAGADNIAVREAIKLGQNLLSPKLTREAVADAVEGMGPAEKMATMKALRQSLDDMAALIGPTQRGGDEAIQEGYKLLRTLNTRASKDKLMVLLGEDGADAMMEQINRIAQAFRVRASVGMRSDTAVNQLTREAIEDGLPRPLDQSVSIPGLVTTGINRWRGANPEGIGRIKSKTYADLSEALTGPRGEDAAALFQRLLAARARQAMLERQPAQFGMYGLQSAPVPISGGFNSRR